MPTPRTRFVRLLLAAAMLAGFAVPHVALANPRAFAGESTFPNGCSNCVDDDHNGLVDRNDPTCAAPANGLDQGIGDVARGKVLAACAKSVQKAGFKFFIGTVKSFQKCTEAAATCIQAKPGDAGCQTKASATCAKIATGFAASEAKFEAAIAAKCDPKSQGTADLVALAGLGFGAEQSPCADEGFNPNFSAISNIASCIAQQHFCKAQRLVAIGTPRAREFLTFAGRQPLEFPCIDEVAAADGAGAGVAADHVKPLLKCSKTIDKLSQSLLGAGAKVVQNCLNAGIACEQVKSADPACVTKARAKCASAFAKLEDPTKGTITKLGAKLAKACGTQPNLSFTDLQADAGLGLGEEATRCAALGAGFDIAQCFGEQAYCEGAYVIEREVPRARELATFLNITIPQLQ